MPSAHADSSIKRRKRVVDEHEQDDADYEIEIVVHAPRELRRHRHAPPAASRINPTHRTHVHAIIYAAPQKQSSPILPPDVNSLAVLPRCFFIMVATQSTSGGAPEPRA
ncbi:hypothetical protein H4582DRAFT_2079220 [Lactarius indigo]|nr:hypothetical protein H4582DRAFT_2079220 [Lactarius indigo]